MSKKQFTLLLGLAMLCAFIGGGLAVQLLSAPSAVAERAFFDSLGVGIPPSSRGEAMRVKGWTVFGQAGVQGGQITFMPPDGTGFYSIDNPGGQRLRFSGGGRPGGFEYMSISHPGVVKIHGKLQVLGSIVDRYGKPLQTRHGLPPIPRAAGGGGKADGARLSDVQVLRDELNAVWQELEQIRERVNLLSQ
ncbi:MAG: hypothetical protein JSV16_04960 [Candidatus Hydrogenedentota bacterium]|nr:MAG: hypothetical protein JSV16_04960 [Candidatus Hydrogenedentota bacterium]